ncbi:MAG TPA: hypothetical protein VL738_03045 [Dactylosporangium sp.]|nr:hypothetical protein [Dactylosporangium sp.]
MRSSPWAPDGDDEYSDYPEEYEEEEPYAPVENLPPAPPARTGADGREGWLPPLYPQEWPPEPRRRDWAVPPPVEPPAVPQADEAKGRSSATAWWIAVGVIIVALAVAAGVLVGLSLAARGGEQPASGAAGATCGGREVLRTTAAPEIAPAVEQAAADIGANQAGGCKLVAVTAQAQYAGGEAWIPATAAWASLAKFQYAPEPVSLARSPIVVAAPRPFAESLGWPGKQPTWAALAAGLNAGQVPKLSMGSPLTDTAGLLAALEVQSAMARTTNDPGIAQTRALSVRARLADADAPPARLLERMGQQSDPARALRDVGLFPVTEQDLWGYAKTRHPVALAGIYPADAIYEADFPLLLTPAAAGDGELKSLATRLGERMRAKEFAAALTGLGLRSAAGDAAPSGDGLAAQYQAPLGLPATTAEWAATWATYKRPA